MWKKCESVQHLVCGCEILAQMEYKRQNDNVAKKVHRDFCKKNGLEHTEKWYEHTREGVIENEEVKVLWDINVQCDNVIEARRPNIIVIDKKKAKGDNHRHCCTRWCKVGGKEREKVEKYQDLKRKIGRLWELKMIEVVPVVIWTLGSVTKGFDRWIEKLGIPLHVDRVMQKTALLATVRIFRKVLDMWRKANLLAFDICYDLPNRRKHGNDNNQNMMLKLNNNDNNNNDNDEEDFFPPVTLMNVWSGRWCLLLVTLQPSTTYGMDRWSACELSLSLVFTGEVCGTSPSRIKNKTCQRAEEVPVSQRSACSFM